MVTSLVFLADAGAAHSVTPVVPIILSCISICIAVLAFSVAFINFRLSRFPHVRLKINVYYASDIQNPKGAYYFDVEVESWGLPIYDMTVKIEADYRFGFQENSGQFTVGLTPVGTCPNPVNAGQVVKFRTTQDIVRGPGNLTVKAGTWGFSDLPAERVTLLVHGSGGREIKRATSERFGTGFWDFDCRRSEVREMNWKRHQSKWRRVLLINLFDRKIGGRVRSAIHRLRMKRLGEKHMRELMRTSKSAKGEAKKDGTDADANQP